MTDFLNLLDIGSIGVSQKDLEIEPSDLIRSQ